MAAGMGPAPTPKPPTPGKTGEDVSHSGKSTTARHVAIGFGGYRKGSVKAQQAFLKAKGFYHGSIDGIRGPMTKSAIAAFKGSRGKGKQPARNPKAPQRHPSSNPGPRRPARAPKGGGGHGGGMGGLIKPKQYASSLVQAQYGPLLKQLRYQRDLASSQGQQNLADINSFYGTVDSTIANLLSGQSQHAGQVVGQQADDLSTILQSLGGSANQGAAPASGFAALMQGALQGQSNAEHGYLTNQQGLAAQARAQALTDMQRTTQQQMDQANNNINAQLASRAADMKVAMSDAQQLKLQQMAAKQNMAIAAGEFNLNQQLGAGQARNQNLQNKALKQQLSGKGDGFGKLTANDKAQMVSGVNTTMYDAHTGDAALPPNQAWVKAAGHLRSLGFNVATNLKARKWLASVWHSYVIDYNNTHKRKFKIQANGTPFTDAMWAKAHKH